MDFTQLYETFKALEDPSFWQEAYMRFYMAWFYKDRWTMYVDGLITTVQVTILALIIGVILDGAWIEEQYCAAVNEGNTVLLEAINTALNELISDGTVQTIIDKYITAE